VKDEILYESLVPLHVRLKIRKNHINILPFCQVKHGLVSDKN